MDVIFIASTSGLAWTLLRTTLGATVGQAAFAMVTGWIMTILTFINI